MSTCRFVNVVCSLQYSFCEDRSELLKAVKEPKALQWCTQDGAEALDDRSVL